MMNLYAASTRPMLMIPRTIDRSGCPILSNVLPIAIPSADAATNTIIAISNATSGKSMIRRHSGRTSVSEP